VRAQEPVAAEPLLPGSDPYEFLAPTRLVVGAGSLARLGALAADLGARRVLVVSDHGVEHAGHTAVGVRSLEAAGITVERFADFAENPGTGAVEAGTAVARVFCPDLLVGLGGGSSMDCAKGINFLLCCGGRMQDYRGRHTATAPLLPTIAVPTTAGTGSETQSFDLITDDATGMKMACGDPRAAFRVAILDVTLTLTQPARVTALTGIDALSHAVESHVSRAATPASRVFSRAAFALLAHGLPRVFTDPADVAARSDVQLGAAWAGLAIENAMLGAAHALANPLTAAHHVVHGQAVGLMLPHVVRFNATAGAAGYGELAAAIPGPATDAPPAERLAIWLETIVGRSGLARSLGALGLATADIPSLAAAAAGQWTAGFNPRPVAAADLSLLYEAAR